MLAAGPGLDAAVAEMLGDPFECARSSHGFQERPKATLIRYGAPWCSEECAERAGDFDTEDGQTEMRDRSYSTDWGAAGLVVEAMREEGWGCYIEQNPTSRWYCRWWRLDNHEWADALADTFPEAVCRAALAAKEASNGS